MSEPLLFVSHVSEDRAAAMEIVQELERRGVSCWIAPRNVTPGRPFDDEIASAIEASRAMLLIFSEHCNESQYIRREVTVAGESHKVVIPLRIENAEPKHGLRVRLSDLHWLDAFVSREKAIDELIRTLPEGAPLAEALGQQSPGGAATSGAGGTQSDAARVQRPEASRRWPIPPRTAAVAAASVIGLVVLGGLGFWFLRPTPAQALVPLTTAREQALKPGDMFQECATCPQMVTAPAGSFTMGSPDSEPKRTAFEGPQHGVALARAFAVGRYEVTFDEWDACVADGGCDGYKPDDAGWGRGRQPVINVSWNDASAYAAWLAKKTGKPYRLLSEAEREYVTRAGTTTPFWWGGSISTSQANYNGAPYPDGPPGQPRGRTVLVDSFAPNPWGLYQVHGNIYEWTNDCWHADYQGAPADGSAWTGGDCGTRSIRGGSWDYNGEYLRSASRLGYPVDTRANWLGFRVARTLAAP